jgi:aminoglycoside phosphotransferase
VAAIESDCRAELEIAARLVGGQVQHIARVGGGRNSRIWRVNAGHETFALKQYPSTEQDPRDRLATETRALRWMADNGVGVVPRVISVDRAENCALLSWVDGLSVKEVDTSDVDQAIRFLECVESLRRSRDFPFAQLASEACLSGAEVERQVGARLARLRALESEPDLQTFLDRYFAPRLEGLLAKARKRLSFGEELPPEGRALVPSDFGFHNVLRDDAGKLTFLDFEYFGWDDPAKFVSDTLLHPGTPMPAPTRSYFYKAIKRVYDPATGFDVRFDALYPLFGLRWVLILLNEFHPERWRGRVLAGDKDDWQEAKLRQLRAAQRMFEELADLKGFA